LEKMTPEQLLMDLNGGMKPSVSELKLFEDLLNNTKFSETMIKIMFLLVSHEKDGVLPGYNYFEKIANTWARAGLKTPQDVINYINKGPERGKKTYERKKRQVKLPDWYGEYEEQLGSLPQDESLSDNEIEQVLEEAKKLL
ncbi:MAG: DnaD domain protein, partial [Bacilli bacterium]